MHARPDLGAPPSVAQLEDLRTPLTGYCYRMLGSAADADDAVQETLVRAMSSSTAYDPARASLSTWVHAIATRICLDLLRAARRRASPMDFSAGSTSGPDLGEPLPGSSWLEPIHDSRVLAATDPAELVVARESIRLAFVALLQDLPPRQRAVLILRDVLAFRADECALILETSTASVTSALQRARAALATSQRPPGSVLDPADEDQRRLLDRYVAAFEAHDVAGLVDVLRDDATTSMPPFAWWVSGGRTIAEMIAGSGACAGARLLPTVISGCPGFGQYRPDGAGSLHPFALVMVSIAGDRIVHLTTFLGTDDRFGEFGLPERLPAGGDEFRLRQTYQW